MSLSLRLIEGKFIDNAPPKKTHTKKKHKNKNKYLHVDNQGNYGIIS